MLIFLIESFFSCRISYIIIDRERVANFCYYIKRNKILLNRVSIDKKIEYTKFYNRTIHIDYKNNLKISKK